MSECKHNHTGPTPCHQCRDEWRQRELAAQTGSAKLRVPPAKFHIGDRVNVRMQEAGQPPTFEAVVCGIDANPRRHGEPEYAVLDIESGIVVDGYTEGWMTPSRNDKLSDQP